MGTEEGTAGGNGNSCGTATFLRSLAPKFVQASSLLRNTAGTVPSRLAPSPSSKRRAIGAPFRQAGVLHLFMRPMLRRAAKNLRHGGHTMGHLRPNMTT
jgi:hypothetical protein